jgi:O-antigen ligase
VIVKTAINRRDAGLFGLFGGLGGLCALLAATIGAKGTLILLAVLVCGFLFRALRREGLRRFRTLRAHFAWWHWLWLLVFISGFVFRLRDSQEISDSALDVWALYRVGLMAITAFALALRLAMMRSTYLFSLFRGLIGRLLIYAVICVCSTAWSTYPAWTLYKSLEYFVVVALLAAILTTHVSTARFKQLLDFTWTMDGFLLLSVWVGALIWPSLAFQPSGGLIIVQLQGVAPIISDNGVGHLAAILSVVALSRVLRQPQTGGSCHFYAALFTLGVTTMILAQARSAILGFVLGAVLVLYFSRKFGLIACLVMAVLLLYLTTGAGGVVHEYMRRGQDADAISSLSGRTDWWEFGWQQFLQSPWMGLGAYTARFTVLAKFGEQGASTVHNTYLETVLGVGIAGLIPVLAVFFGTWRSLIRELCNRSITPARRQLALETTAVLGVLTLRSFFSVGLIEHYDLDFFAVLGYAELLRRLPRYVAAPAPRLARAQQYGAYWAETRGDPV